MPFDSATLPMHFQPKQAEVLRSPATEILFGGAAFGGKSYCIRLLAILWAWAFPGLQIYLFRRLSDDLIKNHVEGPFGFANMLSSWIQDGFCELVQGEVRFWNGSKIYLCHCHEDKDRFKYQGSEIHVLLIDELTHFSEIIYRFLRSRVRLVGLTLPADVAGRFPRIIACTNPGNIGHAWVKRTFIDGRVPGDVYRATDDEGGMLRQFIQSKMTDNAKGMHDDPLYRARLRGLGSMALVKAMEDGDWNIIEGAFFDCWSTERHVIQPFAIPDWWTRARSFDWGSAKPFSVGWWAVVGEDHSLADGRILPRGCLIRYREWYGCKTGQENVGLKLEVSEVAAGILMREDKDEKITYSVGDPAIFIQNGGPSIGEQMARAGVIFRAADNSRVSGWSQLRSRLVADDPMMVAFSTCVDSIRTIPTLMHDTHKPEDLDSDGEDHCFAAGTLVSTPEGDIPIEKLPACGFVHTRQGVRSYRSARLIKADADLLRLTFSDGCVVDCTPDHRFYTGAEWKQAQELPGLWCVVRRFKSSTVTDIIAAAHTFNAKVRAFIASCGNTIMARFLMDSMFTMKMETGLTINRGTCDYLSLPRTLDCTWTASAELKVENKSNWQSLPLQSGIEVKLGNSGILNMQNAIAGYGQRIRSLSFVNAAVKTIRQSSREFFSLSSVPTIAKPVRCVSAETLRGKHPVYCLTVPSEGEFLLSCGLVVSNCADEWRYFCMSRPYQSSKPNEPESILRTPTLGELTKMHIQSCQPQNNRI